MNKYYHRGNGEVVVPDEAAWNKIKRFNKHSSVSQLNRQYLASLPVVAYCDPQVPIGFLDGFVERYEAEMLNGNFCDVPKDFYDTIEHRRLFLVKADEREPLVKGEDEIKRLKELIEKGFKRAYDLARYARDIEDEGYYQEQCFAAFKAENNL